MNDRMSGQSKAKPVEEEEDLTKRIYRAAENIRAAVGHDETGSKITFLKVQQLVVQQEVDEILKAVTLMVGKMEDLSGKVAYLEEQLSSLRAERHLERVPRNQESATSFVTLVKSTETRGQSAVLQVEDEVKKVEPLSDGWLRVTAKTKTCKKRLVTHLEKNAGLEIRDVRHKSPSLVFSDVDSSVCDEDLAVTPHVKNNGLLVELEDEVRSVCDRRDQDHEELEMESGMRHRPEGLDALCRRTKFSKKEIQHMYRGFKQECPNGTIDEETFKEIYGQFFPLGDARPYAHYVFCALDKTRNGCVNFEELLHTLSVITRGSVDEKIRWTFGLYDINNDGCVTKQELLEIVSAVYAMMGHCTEPSIGENTPRNHVEQVFQKLDLNQDGVITIEEFLHSCMQDEHILRGMEVFASLF